MIQSAKAKAWVALIVTVVLGVLGQIVALQLVDGDALKVVQVAIGAVTAIATTLGVYAQANTTPEV